MRTLRLPRMRGDRPSARPWPRLESGATPHARGSTLHGRPDYRGAMGYPACAGIDPLRQNCMGFIVRLPRMRGDRPREDGARHEKVQATPHARGSTWDMPLLKDLLEGYPACAGIDL